MDKDQMSGFVDVTGWIRNRNRTRTRNARMERGEGRHPPPILLFSDQAELRDEAAARSVRPLVFAMAGWVGELEGGRHLGLVLGRSLQRSGRT